LRKSSERSKARAKTASLSLNTRVGKLPTLVFAFVLFICWAIYRSLASFPEWFDEIILKAIVFGIPVWLYANRTAHSEDKLGLTSERFWCGMYMGLFVGGIYGFVGVLRSYLANIPIELGLLFASDGFWIAFTLAMFTAWWESLFFFGYIYNGVKDDHRLPELFTILITVIVFVAFHAPLRFLTAGFTPLAFAQLGVLALFAIGQAILFVRTKSIFAVTISHALWGMVLLIYGNTVS
jgi:hypothetical protein